MTDNTAAASGEVSPLRPSSLASITGAVQVPQYDRSMLRPSIVHIGVGGFHRSHLAVYIDELCRAGHRDWSIVGCGVMPGDRAMAEALDPQDGLYTLIARGANTTEVQVIGSLTKYIHAVPDADAVIGHIANPDTQIVSLTVTEGGYPVDDLTGEYVPTSPNAGPGSGFGIVAAGLNRRFQDNAQPITVMSCDNIMGNGHVTRTGVLGEAARFGDELVEWVNSSVSFPNSMVDRITPATADADRAWLADEHQIEDLWPVVTEPFRQWVVEDNFAGERLPLEDIDVIVTDNVEPYELMKLRLLNAGHSCLAYVAALAGITTVDGAMANPSIRQFVQELLDDEAKPVLPEVAGIDIDLYIESLVERFSNPRVGDQIGRLCVDGTAKFPKFLLPTVRAQVNAGGPVDLCALAVAGWCQYLLGATDDGDPIELSPDPNLDAAVGFAQQSVDDPAAFLDFEHVFGSDLAASDAFRSAFVDALVAIRQDGAVAAIDNALSRNQDPAR